MGEITASSTSQVIIENSTIEKLISLEEKTQDRGFVSGVLSLYLEHTPPLLDKLEAAMRDADAVSVRRIAHRIKGSSFSVGAAAVAQECLHLEHNSAEVVSRPDSRSVVTHLKDTYDQTSKCLRDICTAREGLGSSFTTTV